MKRLVAVYQIPVLSDFSHRTLALILLAVGHCVSPSGMGICKRVYNVDGCTRWDMDVKPGQTEWRSLPMLAITPIQRTGSKALRTL
ncbi:hypothetical protein BDV18DRAFT_147777 [Aspergillus unguis]